MKTEILREADRSGLADDCGIDADAGEADTLQQLDAYLCDLKEMQIRGGLHVLGRGPTGDKRNETLSALMRVPRGDGPRQASLQRAIAADLNLPDFDPLDCEMGAPWEGPKPHALHDVSAAPWRTHGDTVERIELLALKLVSQPGSNAALADDMPATSNVLAALSDDVAPALDASGEPRTCQPVDRA